MPATAPFPNSQPLYPALYLYPLNDSFVPKHISLANAVRVKIGRQTNPKTVPGERNGYFDSKVLSRQHAEVWESEGKIYIKDVKSSNGTFINGERLSAESVESAPWALNSDDIVEFGIDIVGDDNKSIVHHKVAARVVCVFTEQDAQVAARAEQHQQQHQQYQQSSAMINQVGPSNPPAFGFAGAQQRRPQVSQQGLAGMGGMGGSMRPPGNKSGLTFDHILSRLQGELQKSRETGAELNSLTGAMNEIHDTLGGGLPPNMPLYPSNLPPVRVPPPPQPQDLPTEGSASSRSPEQASTVPAASTSANVLTDLQAQLQSTQASLANHVEKIRALETVLAEQESIKREVRILREMMESRRREVQQDDHHHDQNADHNGTHHRQGGDLRGGFDFEDDEDRDRDHDQDSSDDDDDARSISTIVPHELEPVEEEDEEQLAEEARQAVCEQEARELQQELPYEAHQQSEEEVEAEREEHEHSMEEALERRRDQLGVGRPRTPEPMHLGMRDSESYDPRHRVSPLLVGPRRTSSSSPLSRVAATGIIHDDVYEQVMQLSNQVAAVMALTSTFEQQHATAQTTIQALEHKVETLESLLKAQAAQPPPETLPTTDHSQEQESLTEMIAEWKKSVEGQWTDVQEEWNQERQRLSKAREEWETKVRQVDSGLEKLATLQSSAASFQQTFQQQLRLQQHHGAVGNGDAVKHNGLVTPPSPRSQSSDSARYRRRRKRSSGRARSTSRSRSGSRDGIDTDTDSTLASEEASDGTPSSRAYFSNHVKVAADKELALDTTVIPDHPNGAALSLATPDSSVYKLSAPAKQHDPDESADDKSDAGAAVSAVADAHHSMSIQTAVGVLVLSVAAAAVFYRVKPE